MQYDKDTHYDYESVATPIVIAEHVVEDLRYIANPQLPVIWDKPANVWQTETKVMILAYQLRTCLNKASSMILPMENEHSLSRLAQSK